MATTITKTLANLETLKTKELKQKLAELTGKTIRSNNRPYLLRQLTKALEEQAAAEARKAKAAQRTRKAQGRQGRERDPRLPAPGTVIERDYQGQVIRVKVLDEGFEYAGETYRSLSTIAKVATGTIWNGFLFFGLTPYPKRKAQAAA